jgi:hypothetical protein
VAGGAVSVVEESHALAAPHEQRIAGQQAHAHRASAGAGATPEVLTQAVAAREQTEGVVVQGAGSGRSHQHDSTVPSIRAWGQRLASDAVIRKAAPQGRIAKC